MQERAGGESFVLKAKGSWCCVLSHTTPTHFTPSVHLPVQVKHTSVRLYGNKLVIR